MISGSLQPPNCNGCSCDLLGEKRGLWKASLETVFSYYYPLDGNLAFKSQCVHACIHAKSLQSIGSQELDMTEVTLHACIHAKSLQSCPTLVTLWTVARQDPLSMGFSRQEYWSRLLYPPPGNLPDTGMEPTSSCVLHCRQILYCRATGEALNLS